MDQTDQITRQTGLVPDMRTMGFQEGRHRSAAVASDRRLGEIGGPTLPIDPPSRPLL
jgi:hypothetical protein